MCIKHKSPVKEKLTGVSESLGVSARNVSFWACDHCHKPLSVPPALVPPPASLVASPADGWLESGGRLPALAFS